MYPFVLFTYKQVVKLFTTYPVSWAMVDPLQAITSFSSNQGHRPLHRPRQSNSSSSSPWSRQSNSSRSQQQQVVWTKWKWLPLFITPAQLAQAQLRLRSNNKLTFHHRPHHLHLSAINRFAHRNVFHEEKERAWRWKSFLSPKSYPGHLHTLHFLLGTETDYRYILQWIVLRDFLLQRANLHWSIRTSLSPSTTTWCRRHPSSSSSEGTRLGGAWTRLGGASTSKRLSNNHS